MPLVSWSSPLCLWVYFIYLRRWNIVCEFGVFSVSVGIFYIPAEVEYCL